MRWREGAWWKCVSSPITSSGSPAYRRIVQTPLEHRTFFKQIKQTLKLGHFLGHNENAIQWQIWTALLVYILLRFLAWCSQWPHSFIRLFILLRALLWDGRDTLPLLKNYGAAGGMPKLLRVPTQAYLPGFA